MSRRIAPRGMPLAARIAMYSQIEPNGCVVWTGACDKDGYGQIQIAGKKQRVTRAVWEAEYGPIPDGHVVRHTCDNPPCHKLTHLIAGTHAKNAEDRVHRDRFDHQSPRYNRVKLNMQIARSIRRRFGDGERAVALAAEYGIGKEQIYRVINNIHWKERT